MAATMRSVVQRLVRVCSKKPVWIIVLIIPVILQMVEMYYYNIDNHTPSTMCSPDYPDYSKILDMSVTLPDGSIQAGGWIYPPGAVWRGSGIVHGCPCSVGPCIRPCLPVGLNLQIETDDNMNKQLVAVFSEKEEYDQMQPVLVSSGLNPIVMVNVSAKHFSILKANCIRGLQIAHNITLANNGKVWTNNKFFDAANYRLCFNVKEDTLVWNTVFGCDLIDNKNYESARLRSVFTSIIILTFVAVVQLATLAIYLLVPPLRQQSYSKSLINYIFALFIWKVLDITNVFCSINSMVCMEYTEFAMLSWNISLLLSQGIVAWKMRTVFEPRKLGILNTDDGNTKIIFYFVLIWSAFGVNILLKLFFPGQKIEMYLEIVILLVNLYLNVSAMLSLRACLKCFEKTQGSESQRHNAQDYQWTSLFLKFTLVSNLDYTIVLLAIDIYNMSIDSIISGKSPIRYLVALQIYFVNLKGAEIFFINVWQKKTWTLLKNRFYSRK